jgi:allantoate deiminase
VGVAWVRDHQTATVACDPRLTARLAGVAADLTGAEVPYLCSGAGHDAVMLSGVAPIAMLFVRCAGGISHHPDESVSAEDVAVALEVTTRLVGELAV